MYTVLGLLIFTGQIWAAIIMFGGHSKAPRGLKIAIGVSLILMLFSVIGLIEGY